ncbi:MAG: CDP-alcohol phosphatidyltransferase family protein [Myxococcales bacterium]
MARTTLAIRENLPGFPPFAQLLKSRDVEDPVNLWVHRPLAYSFCWLIHRTPITPNQVTLLAISLGFAAAACWVDGSPIAMIWGGALLWSSSIMDGADGILARAKNMHSAFGRALDGSADMLVALATVAACLHHLVVSGTPRWVLGLALPALLMTVLQLNLYDFYKELHLRMTRLDRGGEGDSADEAARLRASSVVQRGPWYRRVSMKIYADYLRFQERLIAWSNPGAAQLLANSTRRTPSGAAVYREQNRLPMRLWMAVSLAPHSYLFAIFGMLDRLDLYLLLRVSLMSVISVVALVTQRRATARTLLALRSQGLA